MLQISRETLIGRIYCSSSIQLASSSVFEAWVLGFFSFLFSALNQSPLSNGHIVFQYSTYTYFANSDFKGSLHECASILFWLRLTFPFIRISAMVVSKMHGASSTIAYMQYACSDPLGNGQVSSFSIQETFAPPMNVGNLSVAKSLPM